MISHTEVTYDNLTGTLAEVVDITQRARILILGNQTNADVTVAVGGGSINLESGDNVTLDLGANGLTATGSLTAKYTSGAPTSGSLYVTYVYE